MYRQQPLRLSCPPGMEVITFELEIFQSKLYNYYAYIKVDAHLNKCKSKVVLEPCASSQSLGDTGVNMSKEYTGSNFNLLVQNTKESPLVLFVGAGVMANIIPLWNSLLSKLFHRAMSLRFGGKIDPEILKCSKSHFEKEGSFSVYEKASIIKAFFGESYLYHLREEIYRDFKNDYSCNMNEIMVSEKCRYFNAISSLCQNQKVLAVVSYNYDDILMKSINTSGKRKAFSVAGHIQSYTNTPDQLPFYYVHGFLPNNNTSIKSTDSLIVLSYDEYFQNMLDPYSWQTITQLHFLRNYTCLFVGASLSDWNMVRMLNSVKNYSSNNRVYTLMCYKDFVKDTTTQEFDKFLIRIKTTFFNEIGVKLIYSGESYGSLADVIYNLKDSIDKSQQ